MSDFFSVHCGLRQGCILSPLLFNIYINDLVKELNELGKGIDINGVRVSCLLYADDVVILAENEQNLQDMLDTVTHWCQKWNMTINEKKTQVVHFRPNAKERTKSNFTCGNKIIDVFLLFCSMKTLF